MKITHINYCGEKGEFDLFFLGNLPVGGWDCNDASWRGEYMNPVLLSMGVEIQELGYETREGKRLANKALKELFEL